mgnify:CR=1 FL=1
MLLIALAKLVAIELTMLIWIAIALGFAGAMVIIRPRLIGVGFQPISALVDAMGIALATILVRMLAQQD